MDHGKFGRIRLIEMMAVRERRENLRAERKRRLTDLAITFMIGLLAGMLFWSVLSPYLNDKAVAAVEQMQGE